MRGFDELSNAMRAQASMMTNSTALPRFCNISSYDVKLGVKVMIQPENTESGWMPLGCIGVGNGFGVAVGPNIGDFVLAVFAEGSFNSGVIVARFFTTDNQPIPVPAGEIWAVHKLGSYVKLQNDGKVLINGQVGVDATAPAINITATGPVNVTAPVINLGALGQTLKALITDVFISLFNGHTHNYSGGVTNTPNQTASAATHATSTVKGG
jgi:hypothetical protein